MKLLSALCGALSSLILAAALATTATPAKAQTAYEAALPAELSTSPALCNYVPCADVLPGATSFSERKGQPPYVEAYAEEGG